MAVQQQASGVDSGFTAKPALRATDPEIARLMDEELTRQEETLELIPSENLASVAVLEALGSWLNNKYAEGVPGKRYYGGCQVVDTIENLARDRCRQLFGADHANVQPHSGSQANTAVYASVMKPGDTVLGMALDQGGHLTHGSPVNFSGKLYNFEAYTVSDANGRVDYDEVRARAHEVAPAMIVAGYSSYPRVLDFAAFEDIARDVGALLLVDMAHFAGLVAGGAHPSPVPHADFVTFTTHKTMRGPWGGVILCRAEHADAIDKSVFPGTQGGPQMHAIAAKAVMFQQCLQPEFRAYAQKVVTNAAALARGLTARGVELVTGGTDNHLMVIDLRPSGVRGRAAQNGFDEVGITVNANAAALARGLTARGVELVTGGTDNHLMVIDLRPSGVRGRAAQNGFDEVGITVNANAFPGHGATAYNPNGIRLGTPSVTTRGMGEGEMDEIADMVALMLRDFDDTTVHAQVRERSLALCRRFPLPYRQ